MSRSGVSSPDEFVVTVSTAEDLASEETHNPTSSFLHRVQNLKLRQWFASFGFWVQTHSERIGVSLSSYTNTFWACRVVDYIGYLSVFGRTLNMRILYCRNRFWKVLLAIVFDTW